MSLSNAAANVIPFIANALRSRETLGGHLESDIVAGLQQAKAAQGKRFRDVQTDLHFFAGDAFSDHMQKLVKALYPRKAERWNTDYAYHRYLNVVSMMQRTLGVMAHSTPDTHLVSIDTGKRLEDSHPDAKLWRKDARDLRFGSVIKAIDRECVLHRTVVVQPAWVKGRMRWLRHLPQNVRIVQDIDDPTRAEDAPVISVGLAQAFDSATADPSLWSSWILDIDGTRRHYLHDDNGLLYEEQLTAGGISPYPLHPFAVWRDGEPAEGEFFLPARESWWSEQRWINRAMMLLAHTIDFQTFAIPWLKHWAGEDPSPTLSPDEPVVTQGDRAEFSFVTADHNVEDMEGTIENALRRSAVAEGLPPDLWSIDLAARSMAALKLSRQHLNERREDRRPDYDGFVEDTWAAHAAVANHHRPGQKYSGTSRLVVEWRPLPMPVDEFQRAQKNVVEFDSGVSHPVVELMERHSLTRPQAIEAWTRNLTTKPEADDGSQNVAVSEDAVLNGAQIAQAVLVVVNVAAGLMPRDAGIGVLDVLFNLERDQAELILGSAGTGAGPKPAAPPAAPAGPVPGPKSPAAARAPGPVPRPPEARE